MSMNPPAPAVTCGRAASRETLTLPAASTCKNERQAAVEAAALKIRELERRRHDRLGVGGAPELEPEQRHPADRPLLDHPRHRVRQPLLQQHPRHQRRDAEPQVDRLPRPQLHRRAAGDDLVGPPLHRRELTQRPPHLAADGRVVRRLRRLPLVRREDDMVDKRGRDPYLLRRDRTAGGQSLDLGEDNAAVGPRRQRLVDPAEVRPFVLGRDVAPARPPSSPGRSPRRSGSPGSRATPRPSNSTTRTSSSRRRRVHLAALAAGIDEGVQPDLGQHAGATSGGVGVHVEEHAARQVVRLDLVIADHPPDFRRGQRRTARSGSCRQ